MTVALTNDAIEAIRALMAGGVGGLRISADGSRAFNGAGPALQVELAYEPQVEDEVIETEGAQLFVAAAAAPSLDEKVLDAEVQAGHVQFELRDP